MNGLMLLLDLCLCMSLWRQRWREPFLGRDKYCIFSASNMGNILVLFFPFLAWFITSNGMLAYAENLVGKKTWETSYGAMNLIVFWRLFGLV